MTKEKTGAYESQGRMPAPLATPVIAPRTMAALLVEYDDFCKLAPDEARSRYPWADRFVMGLPLAPWQREFKWSAAQCEHFITSAWTGVYLGSYIVTEAHFIGVPPGRGGGVEFLPLTNMVIDGQQRLTALELYITDRLAVPDKDGVPTLWSEVPVVDRRRFNNIIFGRGEIRERDEHQLRKLYDVLNFGGVAHEEHERALPGRKGSRP